MLLPACFICAIIISVMAASSNLTSDLLGNEVVSYNFPFVSRAQWQARASKKRTQLSNPVPYVVIHHSYHPQACHSMAQCKQAMKQMQNFHMDQREWWDIGYNFAVGGDGVVYEGRGWTILGAHSLHFNIISIGICLIGDWSNKLPPPQQLKSVEALIATGVEMGYLKPDYKLVGHRQVRETECPGDALFAEIKHWKHYSSYPASAEDLKEIDALKAYFK